MRRTASTGSKKYESYTLQLESPKPVDEIGPVGFEFDRVSTFLSPDGSVRRISQVEMQDATTSSQDVHAWSDAGVFTWGCVSADILGRTM